MDIMVPVPVEVVHREVHSMKSFKGVNIDLEVEEESTGANIQACLGLKNIINACFVNFFLQLLVGANMRISVFAFFKSEIMRFSL